MITDVQISNLHTFFHPDTLQAFLNLSDPEKSTMLSISTGKAPGKMDIVCQLYPPMGIHRNSFPVVFKIAIGIRYHDLKVMVSMVDVRDDGEGLIFGYLAYDYWHKILDRMSAKTDSRKNFVAAVYNPVTREGCVHLSNEVYAVLYRLVQEYGTGNGATVNVENLL
jgi:hypothetical protein